MQTHDHVFSEVSLHLFELERFAVGALIHGGVELMGAHGDAVQGAEVLVLAVVFALLDGTFDRLVGFAVVHDTYLQNLSGDLPASSMCRSGGGYPGNF